MTRLSRLVRRTARTRFRDLVVTLFPESFPDAEPMIEVREKRRRQGFRITLAALYVILAERAAAQAKLERRRSKRAKS